MQSVLPQNQLLCVIKYVVHNMSLTMPDTTFSAAVMHPNSRRHTLMCKTDRVHLDGGCLKMHKLLCIKDCLTTKSCLMMYIVLFDKILSPIR